VYNIFQHGTISYNPLSDEFDVHRGGRSLQDISQNIRRWVSIIIIAVIWIIGTLFIVNSEGVEQGILSVVTFLLGPLTGLLIYLLWKQPKEKDFDIF
jgi:SNF family Na+-dependent transporter